MHANTRAGTHVESVKFYTLNRRSAKSACDPTSRVPQNIEVDSRLKGSYPSARGARSMSVEPTAEMPKLNGVGSIQGKQHAREVLSQKLEETTDKEKRHSNGILMSPVSTKGEVTRDSPTHSGTSTPTSTSSPLLVRKVSSSFTPQQPGHEATVSAPATSATVAKVPIAAASQSIRKEDSPTERKVEEKVTAKALDSNPNLQQQPSNQIKGPPTAANQILAGRQPQESSSRPRDPSSSDSESMASNDTTPLLRPESSASSGPFSPTDSEFQFVAGGHSDENQLPVAEDHTREWSCSTSSSSSEDSHYDRLERIRDEFMRRDSLESSPLLISKSSPGDQRPVRSSREEQGEDQLKYSKLDSPPDSPPTSPLSPLYDHLPPLTPPTKDPEKKIPQLPVTLKSLPHIDLLPSPFDPHAKRRNISQPCLSTPPSARESPCLESPVIAELSETEEDNTPVNR